MAQTVLDQAKGTDRDYLLTLLDDQGVAATGFSAADTISATIWNGGDTASLVTPTCVWVDAGVPSIKLTISAANLSGLDAQPYPIRVTVTHSSRVILVWQGWIQVRATAASATNVPTYCSFRDMLDMSGEWLNRLAMESTYSGFRRERGRARETLDNWILARFRVNQGDVYDLATYSAGSFEGPDPTIKSYLTADYLILTSRVKQITALLALHYVCQGQHEEDYETKAVQFGRRALALAWGYVAEIDTNADGVSEITIPLGTINTRTN